MVDSIKLFDLATRQANWLSIRQTSVASNIANANTPGYKATDVKPFAEVLSDGAIPMKMAVTNPRHIMSFSDDGYMDVSTSESDSEITNSGNNVNIENEVSKGSEITNEMMMNTAIVKAFHRMILQTVKG